MRGSLGGRRTFSTLLSGVLLVFALAFEARAVPLSVGGTVLTPGTTPLGAGTVLTNTTVAFTGINSNNAVKFTGTLQLQVVKETGSGTLDFYFQVFNDSSSVDAINRLTTGNYTGFATDVDWTNNATVGVDSFTADRSSADSVGFSFNTLGGGFIQPGSNSAVLFIRTDATQFTQGNVNLINDATANVLAFAPIPEPSAGALAALGALFAVLLTCRRQQIWGRKPVHHPRRR